MTSGAQQPQTIVLVGLMGSGKSTVAALLGTALDRTSIDLDAVVAERAGLAIAEIFATQGEQEFRRLEHEALRAVLLSDELCVVASGGGVVVSEANRSLLCDHAHTIWLRIAPETAARRVGSGSGRPMLGDDPRASLQQLSKVRAPLYAEVANTIIDVDRLRPPGVVRAICEGLGVAS